MKFFILVLLIDGKIATQTPVGYMTLKSCNEYAARQLVLGPVEVMARSTYQCKEKAGDTSL